MTATQAARLETFRTGTGYLIRISGRGTMRESRVFHEHAARCLEAAPENSPSHSEPYLTVDLSACERMDSTFLGCLVDLHKRFNREGAELVAVAGPPETVRDLLSCSRLDRLLPVRDEPPETVGEGTPLPTDQSVSPRELGVHVMECHRRLAEQGGPASDAFARIANQLEKELSELEA